MVEEKPSAPTGRARRVRLDRERIVGAALDLVDREGLDAFSMRRLGADLGADPMSVYHYVEDQEALFDGIAEALFTEVDVDSLPWGGPWRQVCEGFCHRMHDVLVRHPHAVLIFATRPVRSAAAIEHGNRMVRALEDAGQPPDRALPILRCLDEYVVGHALGHSAIRLSGGRRSRKPPPGSREYDTLARSADAVAGRDHFALGLTALLDGVEGGARA